MGKDSSQASAAPDPTATASAQTKSNIDTANATANLNHTNQYTPWGSQIYTQGPKNADGTSQWSSNITLSPDQQKLLDAQNSQSLGLSNLANSQMTNVSNSLANPVDFSKASNVQNNPLQTSINGGQIQSNIAGGGKIQDGLNSNTGGLAHNSDYGQIQNGIDMSGVSKMVGGDALSGAMKDNQGAAYRQQAAYLDSSYSQRQHDLENKLVQQGVTQNSDAWNNALNNLGQQRTFDYNNAYNNSFATGLAANNQLYNQGLSTNQNQYSQALNNGNFANASQGQGFGQAMSNAQLNNSATGQQFGQNLAAMQANNSAQNQQFGQNLAQGQFSNNAQSQAFGQGLANAGLNNQASGQAFAQSSADRARQLQEMSQQQQIPLNLLNALRTGSQVTSPQFGATPQGNVAGTDIAGLYNNQYQGQLAANNAQIASNNSTTGAIAGLGGSAMMAMAMGF